MSAESQGRWLVDHPLHIVHGLKRDGNHIHLDFFHPASIKRLQKIVDINDEEQIILRRDYELFSKVISAHEGQHRHPER